MHTLRILTAAFNFPLSLPDAVHFKKTVSSAIAGLRDKGLADGIDTGLFYNRSDETGHSENRYPVVQYKPVKGQAAIMAINEGAHALQAILDLLAKEENKAINKKFLISKQNPVDLSAPRLHYHEYTINLLPRKQLYRVTDWLPLDTQRYKAWAASGELKMLAEILDECLPRQIAAMIAGTGYAHSLPFIAHTSSILATKEKVQVYHEKKVPFDCTFYCNLNLPTDIGIGQTPGIGYGRIRSVNNNNSL